MAKVLERRGTLYDEDLLAWAEQQVAHLRARQLDRLDVQHLIDELEAMAGKLRRELKNSLRILLATLLKWQMQPKRRSRSWAATIAEQRVRSKRSSRKTRACTGPGGHCAERLSARGAAGGDRDRVVAPGLSCRAPL
jgi:hypothetical protein